MSVLDKPKTLLALGVNNLFRVGLYRLKLKAGIHPAQKVSGNAPLGEFFTKPESPKKGLVPRSDWVGGDFRAFGYPVSSDGKIPAWNSSLLNPDISTPADRDWWTIPDFDPAVGDIKTIWEFSRFDWLVSKAQRAALGDEHERETVNIWLNDWSKNNPPYKGPNWKCGQEASIRVLHLALAALLLDQVATASKPLQELLVLHLRRIAPTVDYAIGQANNHGTSEAAALFVGGSWLEQLGQLEGAKWRRAGEKLLENRARVLIGEDGSFSQYSVNYHRLMLDAYSISEVWRRAQSLPTFPASMLKRVSAAANWLVTLIQPKTGDVPNFGANDGAHIIKLTDCDYRDFRPSAQLASGLFDDQLAFEDNGEIGRQLDWLGVNQPKVRRADKDMASFDFGGLHVLKTDNAALYLRYPRFRFRPSHADALHCDLWVNGVNLLRDDGTFSYNPAPDTDGSFGTAASHNTITFDGRDQMPKLSRFLYGKWLNSAEVGMPKSVEGIKSASAAYRDAYGVLHARKVQLSDRSLVCTDDISGDWSKAVLRWRLPDTNWELDGGKVSDGQIVMQVEAVDGAQIQTRLTDGLESRYYLKNAPVKVLEVIVTKPCRLVTTIEL